MKRKILLSMLALLLAISLVAIGCAKPAPALEPGLAPAPTVRPIKIKLAAYEPGVEPARAEQLVVDLVNYRSDGRVEMTYYAHGTLGNTEQNLANVSSGALDMCERSTIAIAKYLPWQGCVADLPFQGWSSPIPWKKWWEQVVIPEQNKDIEIHNMVNLPYLGWAGTMGIFSNVGPIHTPSDLKGKLFRAKCPGVEVMWMEATGAKATVIPFSELYTALEQGVVDLMVNSPKDAVDSKFYEVCDDFCYVPIKYFGYLLTANKDKWESLPEDVQQLINEAWEDAAYYWSWSCLDRESVMLNTIGKPPYNMNVYIPTPSEVAQFKEKVMPVYDWARKEYGDDKVNLVLDYVQ